MRFWRVCVLILFLHLGCQSVEESQPNIVWLTTEDNAPHYMKLYNDKGAAMPAIEGLAKKGVVYHRAFSNAPVCSVARSTLITGCYAPRIFTQFHRKAQEVPLPEGIKPFPYYLRQAGYYTSNNSKQDYNFVLPDGVWDASSKKASYKDREPGQPFFHVQNFTVTHEGNLHFDQSTIDTIPEQDLEHIEVFPYHPDTKTFRYSYHHFHKRHQLADQQIGAFLDELEDQGLMENTIIFYFGDHGGVLPRSKGYAYESGLQVPLVVYVPDQWKHLTPHKKGSRSDTFVSFVDFAPTVLSLAGIAAPTAMDGEAVLGKFLRAASLEKKNTTWGYADRFDEKYDLVRTLRVGNYKYIRNYQPFNTDALYNFYRYKMLAYREWHTLYKEGRLSAEQQLFFEPKTAEALYDLESDPHEINNLFDEPEHRETLIAMRKQLKEHMEQLPDLSFFPEPYLLEKAMANPVAFGKLHSKEISELIAVADLSLSPFGQVKDKLEVALASENPWKRYWGLIVCTTFGSVAQPLLPQIKDLLHRDPENLVRIRALEYMALNEVPYAAERVKEILSQARSETEANLMLNSLSLIKAYNPRSSFKLSKNDFPPQWSDRPNDLVNRRIDYLNNN